MPDVRPTPSESDYRNAIRAIRRGWLTTKLVSDRLAWASSSAALAVDSDLQTVRDNLLSRAGS